MTIDPKKRKISTFFAPSPSPSTTNKKRVVVASSPKSKSTKSSNKRKPTAKFKSKQKAKPIDLTPIHLDLTTDEEDHDSDIEILPLPLAPPPPPRAQLQGDCKGKGKGKEQEQDVEMKMKLDRDEQPEGEGEGEGEGDDDGVGSAGASASGSGLAAQQLQHQQHEGQDFIMKVEPDPEAALFLAAESPPPAPSPPALEDDDDDEENWGEEEPPLEIEMESALEGEVASDEEGEFEVPPIGEDGEEGEEGPQQQGSSKDLLLLEEKEEEEARCPVCEVLLGSLGESKRQAHVNACLDGGGGGGGGGGNSSIASSSAKALGFFAPISSLFRSNPPPTLTSTTAADDVKGKGKGRAPPASVKKEKEPQLASESKPSSSLLIDSKPKLPPISAPLRTLSSLNPFSTTNNTTSKPAATPLGNAFTTLMTSHAENSQWTQAEQADKIKGRMKGGERKPVPFYKWIEGMEVTVDAFRYGRIEGCKAYFLSHAHSDHYQNLSSSWCHGPIYCSLTTANLIKLKLNVAEQWLHVLPMDQTVNVMGIDVTLIDANHCPGSVIFLFEGPHTDPKSPYSKNPKRVFRYLHCGDFRASPSHLLHPAMSQKRMDAVYLDTTYLDAKYCFPAQELVVAACAQLVRERVVDGLEEALRVEGGGERGVMRGWLRGRGKKEEETEEEMEVVRASEGEGEGDGAAVTAAVEGEEQEEKKVVVGVKKEEGRKKEKLLVLVGTYSIGKERIVKGIARALETKIYCDDKKLAILQAQDDPELHDFITRDPLQAQVHVCWLQDIKHDALADYLGKYSAGRIEGGFTKLIGLRPTGWTYRGESKEKVPSIAKILEREKLRKFSPAGMYPQRDSTSTCLAYGVPYSEHSSFYELTCFALSLDYGKIIPTVNVHSAASRDKMKDWMTRWMAEKKRRAQAKIPAMVPHRSDTYW